MRRGFFLNFFSMYLCGTVYLPFLMLISYYSFISVCVSLCNIVNIWGLLMFLFIHMFFFFIFFLFLVWLLSNDIRRSESPSGCMKTVWWTYVSGLGSYKRQFLQRKKKFAHDKREYIVTILLLFFFLLFCYYIFLRNRIWVAVSNALVCLYKFLFI